MSDGTEGEGDSSALAWSGAVVSTTDQANDRGASGSALGPASSEHEAVLLERLRQAERARTVADEANLAKDEFLRIVAHDLRTPLTAILGWAKLLRSRAGDVSATLKGLAVIERNARVQARLVDEMLDMSRILSGRLPLGLEPVEIGAVVEAAVAHARAMATAKSVALDVSIEGTPGWMPAVEDGGPDAARVPAIALTAFTRAEEREQILAAGFDLHVAKPVDPAALIAAVARTALVRA